MFSFPSGMNGLDNIKAAPENDALKESQHSEHQFTPNGERPKITKAMKAIEALQRFLDHKASAEFHESATREFGNTPDIPKRDFCRDRVL